MKHFEREILEILATAVDATRQAIMDGTQCSLATFGRYMSELSELDYVTYTKAGHKHVYRYSITDKGMTALIRDRRIDRYGQVVSPMTINKLEGIYTPPVWMTRNNGHTHIASNGVRC